MYRTTQIEKVRKTKATGAADKEVTEGIKLKMITRIRMRAQEKAERRRWRQGMDQRAERE